MHKKILLSISLIFCLFLISSPALAADPWYLQLKDWTVKAMGGGGGGNIPVEDTEDDEEEEDEDEIPTSGDAHFDLLEADEAELYDVTIKDLIVTDSLDLSGPSSLGKALNVSGVDIIGLTISSDQITGSIPTSMLQGNVAISNLPVNKIVNQINKNKTSKIKRSQVKGLNKELNSKLDASDATVSGDLVLAPQTTTPDETKGSMYFNDTDDNLYLYTGTSWVDLTSQGTTLTAGTGIAISDDNVISSTIVDTDTNTTYTAGNGLALSGTEFSLLNSCSSNQVLKYNGTTWACAADTDTDTDTNTTYTAGNGLTLSGTEFVVDLDGTTLQSTASGLSVNSITAAEVSDFDTEVGNNATVTANTSARHTQGTDSALDTGGANEFTAAQGASLQSSLGSVTALVDEDDMTSDSNTAVASQQSIKAYVDAVSYGLVYDIQTTDWAANTSSDLTAGAVAGWTLSTPANFNTAEIDGSGNLHINIGGSVESEYIYKDFTIDRPLAAIDSLIFLYNWDASSSTIANAFTRIETRVIDPTLSEYIQISHEYDGAFKVKPRVNFATDGSTDDMGSSQAGAWNVASMTEAIVYRPGHMAVLNDAGVTFQVRGYANSTAGEGNALGDYRMWSGLTTTIRLQFNFYNTHADDTIDMVIPTAWLVVN